jgi:hypothetical protein
MRINHRLTLRVDGPLRRELATLGITVAEGLASFDASEADAAWPRIMALVTPHKPIDIVTTAWTAAEIEAAHRLRMTATGHFGYPMPDGDNGYLEATYDLRDYCSNCGIGKVQKAPFRFKAEPKWGRRCLLQLNWVFDEYFATPECWERVFRPFGVRSMAVLKHSNGEPLQTVVQLVLDQIAPSPLSMGDHPYRLCPRCERRKYLPFQRGCFPRFAQPVADGAILKTREYFGDGAKGFREVLVSRDVYAAITEKKALGCEFAPQCEGSV